MCICSLSYPACKAHEPYCIFIRDLFGAALFLHTSHKRHGFQKKVIEHEMCVFIFHTIFVSKIYHPKKNSERYYHICAFLFKRSKRYSCQILMKIVYLSTVTQISSFVKILLVGAELFHEDAQTDMTKMSRFSILRKRLKLTEYSLISQQKLLYA